MNKFIIDCVTTAARTVGYSVLPTWRREQQPFAEHLAKVFSRYGITTVLDVGANNGQYRDFLRDQVGFSGTIHSFEPIPSLAERIRQRSKHDPNWHIHNLALGNANGEQTLNIMARDSFSSFLQPDDTSASGFSASNTIVDSISVQIRRLDDAFDESINASKESCYLKIDTQGYDLEVIKGASAFLQRTPALQFELAIQRLYTDVPDYRSMLATMEGLGFDISGLFQISGDEYLRAVEFDCVMVRCSDTSRSAKTKSFPGF